MDGLETLEVRELSPVLGAEILGLDLSKPLSGAVVEQIRELWLKYCVLVIRGEEITQEEQLRFAANFGTLGERKRAKSALKKATEGIYQNEPHTLLVSNITVDGKPIGAFGEGDMWFHIDAGYTERPYKHTFLYGVELPSSGGDTLFANGYMAYDALSDDLKKKITGRKALHIHQYKRSAEVDLSEDISKSPHWYHPMVVTHPETGRKSLFVDRLMTAAIEGMDADESKDLLSQLFDHIERAEFIYAHQWALHDLVMWDNRCLVHGRTYFPEDEDRLLRRCTIEGEPVHE
ncbi:MAG: TauD/TfdA family dioxygenase [Rhodospirillales bacterium]|nr:TauD/TfdA family dioxygenase [Rhodospirillales bacterium]MBT4006457.1 TauD/TfdA family dioxygenase [Rhodospirillales bacterium]MBT5076494.1 TauD/TfdA family dioxygenase [Rhodospirillales bacterium]MBT5112611.1 TauD/TfdA family dioxygenase [Rhodospirillales bacterium]MBT5673380.1 TauD/TfdA family dioxygenase [Rhodospirillales bacterium]